MDGGCKLTETRARERRRKTESCYVDLGQCRGQISCCQKPGCEVREKKRRESAVIVGWVGEASCERPLRATSHDHNGGCEATFPVLSVAPNRCHRSLGNPA